MSSPSQRSFLAIRSNGSPKAETDVEGPSIGYWIVILGQCFRRAFPIFESLIYVSSRNMYGPGMQYGHSTSTKRAVVSVVAQNWPALVTRFVVRCQTKSHSHSHTPSPSLDGVWTIVVIVSSIVDHQTTVRPLEMMEASAR